MSYSTSNAIGRTHSIHATLIIDGIPVLFGTKAGLVMDTSSIFVSGSPASLTSVDAIVADSLSVDGQKIDYDKMLVPPSNGSVKLRLSTSWDKYFERRRTPSTMLTGSVTDATTSNWPVQNSGSFAGIPAYVDRETVLVNTVSTALLTSVTRNYCALPGTKAARHSELAVVGSTPRYMKGRPAVLHLWNTDTDNYLVRRLLINNVSHNPQSMCWDITFDDAMMLLDRKVAVGFHDVPIWAAEKQNDGTTDLSLGFVGDYNREFESSSTLESKVLLKSATNGLGVIADMTLASGVITVNTATTSMVIEDAAEEGGGWETSRFDGDNGQVYINPFASTAGLTATRVYQFKGSPMLAFLQVALSDRGDGNNNATYDVLFGITSTSTGATRALASFENEVRMGAAIPAALLNLDSNDANGLTNPEFLSEYPAGWNYVLGPKDVSFVDFMTEVAWAHNGVFFFNTSGKLSFKRLTAVGAFTTATAALTEDEILRMSPLQSSDDETEIAHTFRLKCNYDVVSEKTTMTVNIYHPLTKETYRENGQTFDVVRRGLKIDTQTSSLEEIAERFNRVFARRQYGIRKYKLMLPWRYHTLVPGDVVTVTHSALNSFSGGTLSAEYFEVASTSALDFKNGTVEIEVHDTWSAKPFSPVAKVSSYANGGGAGPFVFTLTASDKYTNDTTPGRFFAIGWKVRLLDKSASPTFGSASSVMTITAVGDTSITVSADCSITPAAGDVIVQALYDNSDNTTANAEQSIAQRGYAFQADANCNLGTADANADTWG